tara:strand:- start:16111 stop:16632 length:522 start_codon:yes stop_codon:yes gene_type:complete
MKDLRSILRRRLPKAETEQLAEEMGDDPARFDEAWQLVVAGDAVLSPRAAWLIDHLMVGHPALLEPYLEAAISELARPSHHNGVHRILAKVLSTRNIPEPFQGELFGVCRDHLLNPDSAVAIKVHCMEIATKIVLPYPELKEELVTIIEMQMSGGSAAIRSRGRKLLRKLGCY